MLYCNGSCLTYKKSRKYDTDNSKNCKNCNVFIEWEGSRCPCCTGPVKTTPRNSKRRKIYRKVNLEKSGLIIAD